MDKFLFAGLGNMGAEYEHTRHNIGFDVLDAFVRRHEGVYTHARLADRAEIRWKGKQVICIKPSTYMNLSGRAVKYWLDKEKIAVANLLVLVDEKSLPLSKIRIRPSGSDGGHNGLKSIQECLQTNQYPRLRFGIGDDFRKGEQVDFVLGRWSEREEPLVQLKIEKLVDILDEYLVIGIERTMNQVNKLEFAV